MGAPEGLWSDNQPFKAAAYQDLLRKYNVSWHSSSPHYPQSNGRAEAEIKQIKKLVCGSKVGGRWDADQMAHALMLFRNAPRCGGGPSPAESVFGRPIRDGLPAHARSFAKEWQRPTEELERRVEAAREKSREFYNAHTHTLAELVVGDHILIQDPDFSLWSTPGKVIEIGSNRDYLVRTADGKEFRRKRRHLLRRVPIMPSPAMTQRQQVANALSKTNDSRHNQSQRTNQSSPSNHRHQPKAISAAPATATQFDSIYPLDNSKDGTAAQSLTSTTRTPSGRSKED